MLLAAGRALVRSLALSGAVLIPGLWLMSVNRAVGAFWLLGGSFALMAWTNRRPWRVTWLTCLAPPVSAGLCFLIQMQLSGSPPGWALLVAGALGLVIGGVRGRAHEVFVGSNGVRAQRTTLYLAAWLLAYGASQGFALADEQDLFDIGRVGGMLSTAMLATVSLMLFVKMRRLSREGARPAAAASFAGLILAISFAAGGPIGLHAQSPVSASEIAAVRVTGMFDRVNQPVAPGALRDPVPGLVEIHVRHMADAPAPNESMLVELAVLGFDSAAPAARYVEDSFSMARTNAASDARVSARGLSGLGDAAFMTTATTGYAFRNGVDVTTLRQHTVVQTDRWATEVDVVVLDHARAQEALDLASSIQRGMIDRMGLRAPPAPPDEPAGPAPTVDDDPLGVPPADPRLPRNVGEAAAVIALILIASGVSVNIANAIADAIARGAASASAAIGDARTLSDLAPEPELVDPYDGTALERNASGQYWDAANRRWVDRAEAERIVSELERERAARDQEVADNVRRQQDGADRDWERLKRAGERGIPGTDRLDEYYRRGDWIEEHLHQLPPEHVDTIARLFERIEYRAHGLRPEDIQPEDVELLRRASQALGALLRGRSEAVAADATYDAAELQLVEDVLHAVAALGRMVAAKIDPTHGVASGFVYGAAESRDRGLGTAVWHGTVSAGSTFVDNRITNLNPGSRVVAAASGFGTSAADELLRGGTASEAVQAGGMGAVIGVYGAHLERGGVGWREEAVGLGPNQGAADRAVDRFWEGLKARVRGAGDGGRSPDGPSADAPTSRPPSEAAGTQRSGAEPPAEPPAGGSGAGRAPSSREHQSTVPPDEDDPLVDYLRSNRDPRVQRAEEIADRLGRGEEVEFTRPDPVYAEDGSELTDTNSHRYWEARDRMRGQPRAEDPSLSLDRPQAVDDFIGNDEQLRATDDRIRELWRQAGGGRAPGTWDRFESAVGKAIADGELSRREVDYWFDTVPRMDAGTGPPPTGAPAAAGPPPSGGEAPPADTVVPDRPPPTSDTRPPAPPADTVPNRPPPTSDTRPPAPRDNE